MNYIVTADYYDWRGLFTHDRYWIIDNTRTCYKAQDSEDKVKELIDEIKMIKGDTISRIDINVYEIGRKVTDKFI